MKNSTQEQMEFSRTGNGEWEMRMNNSPFPIPKIGACQFLLTLWERRFPRQFPINYRRQPLFTFPLEYTKGENRVRGSGERLSSASPDFLALPLQSFSTMRTHSQHTSLGNSPYALVVVGTSLGGLHALEIFLAGFPKNFSVPVAIVQHRHRDSDDSLSLFLQRHCALVVVEPEDKEKIVPGRVYLAPADYHLLVEANHLTLSTEAPVSYARPAIDVLFESAADAYVERVIGVILTGASHDGAKGLAKIKANGGLAVVQEPTTAECMTMPKAAIATVAVDWILPLNEIAPLLVNLCHPALR